MRPRILLSVELEAEKYIHAVELAGGTAEAQNCPAVDLSYDGLIVCGGRDVNPALYGEDINGAVEIDFQRDTAELALIQAYVEAGKPVFGICRGCQIMNVYFGGSLHQHLENTCQHRSETKVDRTHSIEAADNSLAQKLYGKRYIVNSVHHEAVKELGRGLIVTEVSDDGIIEGFQRESLPIFAVQWHPERLVETEDAETVDGLKIFEYFVSLCKL